ncbi:hypothetical protein P7C70_g7883, partial [Phenoliferia sp. Uapishka_3]
MSDSASPEASPKGSTRREKNRVAAKVSRDKNKAMVAEMKADLARLREQNASLASEKEELEDEMAETFEAGLQAGLQQADQVYEKLRGDHAEVQLQLGDSQRRESRLEEAASDPLGFSGHLRDWKLKTVNVPICSFPEQELTVTSPNTEQVPIGALLRLYKQSHKALPQGIVFAAPHPVYSPLHVFIDTDCSGLFSTTYEAIVMLDLNPFLLKCGCVLFIVQGRETLLDPDSIFSAYTGAEKITSIDTWQLCHLPKPSTGAKRPLHVHSAGEEVAFKGSIYRKKLVKASDAWTLAQRAAFPTIKNLDLFSFPRYTSRPDHKDRPIQPGFTDAYLYISSGKKECTAFEFHIEDMEATSINTSLWTGRSKPSTTQKDDEMQVDDDPSEQDSAKIWIMVSPLFRARVEAGLDKIIPRDMPNSHEASCNLRYRDFTLLPTPEFFRHLGIPFFIVVQRAGMTVHIASAAYHGGYNTGPSVNWAVNFEGPGLTATGCQCPKTKRNISVHTPLY